MRINKYIAGQTNYSRRQADELITSGKVKVNNKILTKQELGLQIDPEKDEVILNNKSLNNQKQKFIYLALNKPKNYVCTTQRQRKQNIILDLIPKNLNVYPVGRLDKNSEGLIILTNDGDLSLELTHPRYEHEKEYIVTTQVPLNIQQLKLFKKGIELEEGLAKVKKIDKISQYEYNIILITGLKRQIRRMVKAVDNKVVKLQRIRINNLFLDNLPIGKWKYINKKDII